MTPPSRFKGLIKRTEFIVLALCVAVGISLYLSGTVFAQTDYDYWQSYLDSQVGGMSVTATTGECGTGTILLQWAAISQVDGYRVARGGSDVVYEGASPTYTDSGLSAGSTYKYYFTAYKGYTTSNTTKMVNATAPGNCALVAPAAPTNVSASFNQSAGGIVLNWTQSSSYTSFNILRRTGGGSFAQIGSFTGSQATYTDTANLSPGTTYEYQVIGCSGTLCSSPSSSASATTPTSTTQTTAATTTTTTTTTVTQTPSPATGLTAQFSLSAGGIVLSWTNAGTVAATTISIERRTTSGTFAAIHSVSGSQTTHTDSSSLSPATTYEYRVISCNGTGNCATSASTATAATPASTSDSNTTTTTTTTTTTSTTVTSGNNTTSATAPAAPVVSVSAPSGCGTFTLYLTWSAVQGATSYDIYRDAALVIHTTTTSYGDIGLPAGSLHTYRIAAKNSYGSTLSTTVSGTVPPACASTTATQTATNTTQLVTPQTQITTEPATSVTSATAPVQAAPVINTQTTATEPVRTTAVRPVTIVPTEPVTIAPPTVYVAPLPQESSPVTPAQAQFVASIQAVADSVTATQVAVDAARDALIASIDEHINMVLRATPAGGMQPSEKTIQAMRTQLINSIDITFAQGTMPTPADEARLQNAIKEGFAAIDRAASFDPTVPSGTQQAVTVAVGVFADAIEQATKSLQETGADDVYKDSNNDGISDYDSVHIYNIDPIKLSPVTIVDGKKLTAGDKVLLGYDPTAKDLVALPREEAEASFAPETTVYKVEEVKLTEKKQVAIAGTALPNSYVTLYIYSTPIVVTVKTDRNGRWNYTMDRELETGEHKIYAASVDNTGKIVAKTVAIPFTKTAEAATLDNIPSLGAASVQKPSITNNRAFYPLVALSLLFIFGVLYVVGKDRMPKHETPPSGTP